MHRSSEVFSQWNMGKTNEGGFKVWWVAAQGIANVLEGGLIGEVDVMFGATNIQRGGWAVERSIRMADGLMTGDGFAHIED